MVDALLRNAAREAVYEHLSRQFKNHDSKLGAFIKAILATAGVSKLNCTELTDLLKTRYGFNIPEAVVHATVLKILPDLVRQDDNGDYLFDPKQVPRGQKMQKTYQDLTFLPQHLLASLFAYIAGRQKRSLDPQQKTAICEAFYLSLFDREAAAPWIKEIGDFVKSDIIENESLSKSLKKLRTAVILYEGLHYRPRANESARLRNQLTIFLDTGLLLDALGYNGAGPKKRFDESQALVKECNPLNKKKHPKQAIRLRYVSETQEELRRICGDETRFRQFEQQLKKLDILFFPFNIPENNCLEYGLHDAESLQYASAQLAAQFPGLHEQACAQPMQLFSKINCLRKGKLARKLEEAQYILLTNQALPLHLAAHTRIRFLPKHVPFAVDMGWLTNNLWTTLRKGFAESPDFNPDFNRVARTYSALEASVGPALNQKYEKQLKALKGRKSGVTASRKSNRNYRDKNRNDDDDNSMQAYTVSESTREQQSLEDLARQVAKHDQMLRESGKKMECIVADLARIEAQLQEFRLGNAIHSEVLERLVATGLYWDEANRSYSIGILVPLRMIFSPFMWPLIKFLLSLLIHPGS